MPNGKTGADNDGKATRLGSRTSGIYKLWPVFTGIDYWTNEEESFMYYTNLEVGQAEMNTYDECQARREGVYENGAVN